MIYQHIENILSYAQTHLELNPLDLMYKRNLLYDILNLDGTNDLYTPIDTTLYETPDQLLEPIIDDAIDRGIIDIAFDAHLAAKIMGLLSLDPSLIEKRFHAFEDISDATTWFYQYCIKNNYVQKKAIDRNIVWQSHHIKNPLQITINLTKPEKKNADIKKLLDQVKNDYPKSLLAKENIGFRGHIKHPARQNIRYIDVDLKDEPWFWQYSPYAYYKEHLIVINKAFVPMVVNQNTFTKLFDFIDIYPHYFIGSNASLPIIGGSILNHEHYQGGLEKLPMHYAKPLITFKHPTLDALDISILDWYNSVIQIKAKNRLLVEQTAIKLFGAWTNYSNEVLEISASTNLVKHNSASVIARKSGDYYILDMILRNNGTNQIHPDGIFHAHKEFYNIKSEGIGLIEAMGLFILPPRLKTEIDQIIKLLQNDEQNIPDTLAIHHDFIKKIAKKTTQSQMDNETLKTLVYREIDLVCEQILYNTAVFKPKDLDVFTEFITKEGYRKI